MIRQQRHSFISFISLALKLRLQCSACARDCGSAGVSGTIHGVL